MDIVPATEADISTIVELEKILDGTKDPGNDHVKYADPVRIAQDITDRHIYVAKEGECINAVVEFYPDPIIKSALYLSALVVQPGLRGKGIGSSILEFVIEQAKIQRKRFVTVTPTGNSKRFYCEREFEESDFDYIRLVV